MRPVAILSVVAASLVAACVNNAAKPNFEVIPSTYELAREPVLPYTVGRLRRLALISPSMGYEDHAWRWTLQMPDSADAIADFLSDKKGYEIVAVLGTEGSEEIDPCITLLTGWATDTEEGELPPAELAICARKVGRDLNADGLTLLWGGLPDPDIGAADFLLLVPTLGFSMIWTLMKAEGAFSARIVEVATGRAVWRRSVTGELGIETVVTFLFRDIEPALPGAFEAR